jgi:mono/diheme cytochrome c family protein
MCKLLLGGAVLAAAAAAVGVAAPVRYELPEDTTVLAPGPGQEVTQANCMACHSVDYIATQPRGFADPAAFWTAEVTKMRRVYGAQIDDADVQAIVAYLAAQYGR